MKVGRERPSVGQAVAGPRVPERWATVALENVRQHRAEFSALADPFKVIAVNPRDLRRRCLMNYATGGEKGSKYHDWGRVVTGHWDSSWQGRPNEPLEVRAKWRAVVDRYVAGMTWGETGIIDALAPGPGKPRGRSREELVKRYRELDAVFDSIRTEGFRLTGTDEGLGWDNLFVSIGRDGRLLVGRAGTHRLAIAAVLGLSAIPVYVLSRHDCWQRLRERYAAAPDHLRRRGVRHPDLEEFRA